ncbi:MAG: hypothetical protein U0793_28800 [Gemmataceae bacterium]
MATLVQAVRLALHYGETHLGVTDVFGEDVGLHPWAASSPPRKVSTAWNTPLDEPRHHRRCDGDRLHAGGRPFVCEIQFCDYGFNTIDLLKIAGNQALGGGRALRYADRAHDAVRLRHPRQPLPQPQLREPRQPACRLEDRHAVQPARRLRSHARPSPIRTR